MRERGEDALQCPAILRVFYAPRGTSVLETVLDLVSHRQWYSMGTLHCILSFPALADRCFESVSCQRGIINGKKEGSIGK